MSYLDREDVASLKRMVREYHTTMHDVADAAQSISHVVRGVGNRLHGLGITGPWQEIGNPLSDMWATNDLLSKAAAPYGVIVGQSAVTPAQSVVNTEAMLTQETPDFLISDNSSGPYTVTKDYVKQAQAASTEIREAPGKAITAVEETVSKYFHIALWIAIAAGVIVFLPEIKAVSRVIRNRT